MDLNQQDDQAIVAQLELVIGQELEERAAYDERGRLVELDLSGLRLSEVPVELAQLSRLQALNLSGNELREVPVELAQLSRLRALYLNGNELREVPVELAQLSRLQVLDLSFNRLTRVPVELAQLSRLQRLNLSGNELWELPVELCQLSSLQELNLSENELWEVPAELAQFSNLQRLDLSSNQLTQVPIELCQLSSLQELNLSENELWEVPAELGLLANLRWLDLYNTQLTQLPAELGQLSRLQRLDLDGNPLLTPPPEIVTQGTAAVLTFLQELQQQSTTRLEAKLLLVGEGGTGKTSLLRSLRGEPFIEGRPSTHGIDLGYLSVPYPKDLSKELILNTWDFGGQHIYQATHQFFLTTRSLYLVLWNAILGAEPCRLPFWLNTIQALAPDAPILLVATHIEDRPVDFNAQAYKDAYPQIKGCFSVSNRDGTGIQALKEALAFAALEIELVGQPWPKQWMDVEQTLLALPQHHIYASDYQRVCEQAGVQELAQGTLGAYLHDLGKILYFWNDPILRNLVVLKPNWITKAISRVLEDKETRQHYGILSHASLSRIWKKDEEGNRYDPQLYPVFLRLMERFDLSYQIPSPVMNKPASHSLVPQLLPEQPPTGIPDWPYASLMGDQRSVEMRFQLSFVPAGLMPWFIVRTHDYTQNLHWREGVILYEDGHIARVELNALTQEIRLVVWGVQPLNFFNILMSTLDLILDRFEGLRVQREVPCICSWEESAEGSRSSAPPCPRFYHYKDLIRRIKVGRYEVECPESFRSVSVLQMLYGIHGSTHEQVIDDIRRDQQLLLQGQQYVQQTLTSLPEMFTTVQGLSQLMEMIWRQMHRQWNYEMQRLEAECPNIFFLSLSPTSKRKRLNPKNWVSQEYLLHLICQHPSGPHPVGEGYSLREAKSWWLTMRPWFNHVMTILKVTLPVGKAMGDLYDATGIERIQKQITLMEEINNCLPTLAKLDTLGEAAPDPHLHRDQQATNAALRALYQFLIQVDASHTWGGLCKVVTPDGNILWLCEKHRQEFEAKPLDPRYAR